MDWTTLALATTSGLARGLYPIFLKTVCGTAFPGCMPYIIISRTIFLRRSLCILLNKRVALDVATCSLLIPIAGCSTGSQSPSDRVSIVQINGCTCGVPPTIATRSLFRFTAFSLPQTDIVSSLPLSRSLCLSSPLFTRCTFHCHALRWAARLPWHGPYNVKAQYTSSLGGLWPLRLPGYQQQSLPSSQCH